MATLSEAKRPYSFETKYSFQAGRGQAIESFLRAACLPDPRYPQGFVNSVYFDTPDLQLLANKVNSDYLKAKTRVRWYRDSRERPAADEQVAFLELKAKYGTWRSKDRKPIKIPTCWLSEGSESFRELSTLGPLFRSLGARTTKPLFPMIVIRYHRCRFIEPLTGSRIALDSAIRYSRVNELFFPPSPGRQLRLGVLEIKGQNGRLPSSLYGLRDLINRRESFSKYAECWLIHFDPFFRAEYSWAHYRK